MSRLRPGPPANRMPPRCLRRQTRPPLFSRRGPIRTCGKAGSPGRIPGLYPAILPNRPPCPRMPGAVQTPVTMAYRSIENPIGTIWKTSGWAPGRNLNVQMANQPARLGQRPANHSSPCSRFPMAICGRVHAANRARQPRLEVRLANRPRLSLRKTKRGFSGAPWKKSDSDQSTAPVNFLPQVISRRTSGGAACLTSNYFNITICFY